MSQNKITYLIDPNSFELVLDISGPRTSANHEEKYEKRLQLNQKYSEWLIKNNYSRDITLWNDAIWIHFKLKFL